MKSLVLVLWGIFLLSNEIIAQEINELRFLPNDINDRLPHSDINTIMQDRNGFMWFGTYSGLCRYDGKNLTTLQRDIDESNSLSNSRIKCLLELYDGSILIGTEGGGLNHFFPYSEKISVYSKTEKSNSIGSDVINIVFQAKDGSIWIGTNSGLDQMHIERDSVFFEKVFVSTDGVLTIAEDSEGNLLFGSGVSIFEKRKDSKYYSLKLEYSSGINIIMPIDSKKMILGCENGLHILRENKIQTVSNYPIISAYRAHDSSIWIGTRGYGLLMLDSELNVKNRYTTNKSDPRSLTFDEVSSLYEDHSGVLWIGTFGRGLNKLDLRAKKFELYSNRPWEQNSLSGDRVMSFFEDNKNQIWIGLRSNGINILNSKREIIALSDKEGDPFFGQNVSAFYQDLNGALWIGTWGGGIVTIAEENIKTLLDGGNPPINTLLSGYISVEKIVEDYEGHIWLSTTTGLIEYVPGSENFYSGEFRTFSSKDKKAPISDDFIRDIFIERGKDEKIVWVGTRNGLNRLAINGTDYYVQQIFADPVNPNSLPSNFISVITKDKSGNLWLSGLGGGIAKMVSGRDGNGEFKFIVYTKNEGLPNNDIETILEDEKGQFWMGGYGLIRFNPTTEDIVGFDINDGLQSNAFKVWSALKLRNGNLIFGGTKGFNLFDPAEIKINEIPPILTLTELKVNNEKVSVQRSYNGYFVLDSSIIVTKKIELPYELNSFTISFGALHYTSSENNQLKFKLSGVDDDWLHFQGSETSRNYSQLRPGAYTFVFSGANSDNIWATDPLSLEIIIKKPYWASYYAIALYLVLLILVLLIFRKYSVIQVKEMGQIKLERMRRDQKEELNRLKFNFYTEVSHELRTPLSLIIGPVGDILETPSLNLGERKKLEIVRRNVERMANLVDEIMQFSEVGKEISKIKVAEGDIIKFVKEIQLFFSAEASGRNIGFHFDSEVPESIVFFDRDKLEKAFFNLLSNAFKHTPEGGKIEINAKIDNHSGCIRFSVFNTGEQIPKEDLAHIFKQFYTAKNSNKIGHGIGLSLAYQVIDQHSGKIWVENNVNGVCFYVELRFGNSHFDPANILSNFTNSENIVHYINNDLKECEITAIQKGKKVLIVEDNNELRNYIALYLSDYYEIITASNGEIGFQLAVQHSPDVIISDMMMPELDGLNMCRKIKMDINTSHIPVIILTARTSLMQQIDGYEVGADAYLTKPFSTQLLLARISNLINSRENLRKLFKENLNLSPKEIAVTSLDEKILTKTIKIIEDCMGESDFGVDKLCEEIGMSRSQLYRKIKALTSYSINDFIRLIRLKRAAQLLVQDNSSISTIMRQVGFENQSYFSRAFKEQFGVSPKQYMI